MKQFSWDILEEKLNSRDYNNKENREKYFGELSQKFGLNKTFVYPKNGFSKGRNKKEIESSKIQYSLFPNDANTDKNYQKSKTSFNIYDTEIADHLSKLDAVKYACIYSSVKRLSTNSDTPFLYIAFSCLFEGLTNHLGCLDNTTFDKFLENMLPKGVFSTILNMTEDRMNTMRTLKKIRTNANMAKHGTIAAPLTYREICNDMKVLKPLLIYLIKEASVKKVSIKESA